MGISGAVFYVMTTQEAYFDYVISFLAVPGEVFQAFRRWGRRSAVTGEMDRTPKAAIDVSIRTLSMLIYWPFGRD